jgi:predicted aconitase
MKRRDFVKSIPLTALLPTGLSALAGSAQAATTKTAAAEAEAASQVAKPTSSPGHYGIVPDYAKNFLTSDMQGLGPDGKPTGQRMTFTGASKADAKPGDTPHQMTLTQEEQDTLNGKEGEEKAKLMKILVAYGNAFGADKLVDLGGAPHSNMFVGTDYMKSMIAMFDECAKAGLKSYAPFTVNPRPYDLYNLNNNVTDMEQIYDGYKLQRELDWMLARLGAPDLNFRSCACYLDEVGNAPKPGTYVAWAESSAVNYGNSVLGIRTNRNGAGMDLLSAILAKAPNFGLMTDEGRMAKWLVEIKTTGEPDWGAVGSAIGIKVVEDVPFITGLDKYFEGGKVTADNLHLLKAMGSGTAATGAVGLYHVEGVTPDAREKGRDLLVEGYQTYVIDDAEQARIIKSFPNLWKEKDGDPTAAFIGCPHNSYYEIVKYGRLITEALDKAGKKEAAIPVYMFCVNPVKGRLVEEEGELAGKMRKAGVRVTNMCAVSYAGMKGVAERTNGISNSAKMRAYSNFRYLPDNTLVEAIVTGKIPS